MGWNFKSFWIINKRILDMKITLSKSQWEMIGKNAGWIKEELDEPFDEIGDIEKRIVEKEEKLREIQKEGDLDDIKRAKIEIAFLYADLKSIDPSPAKLT